METAVQTPSAPNADGRGTCDELQTRLESALGIAMRPVSEDGPIDSHTDSLPASVLADARRRIQSDGFAIESLNDGGVAVLLEGEDGSGLKCGLVRTTDPVLLRQLIGAEIRLMNAEGLLQSQDRDMESCLVMLSDKLEEQTWLHTLAEQIRLCDLSSDVKSVAERLLGSLKGLIRATSIGLFQGDFETSDGNNRSVVTWVGEQPVPDQFLKEWLRGLAHDGHYPNTYVANQSRVEACLQEHGIWSVLAVPLTSSGRLLGWMVALNRVPPDRIGDSFHGLSEMEFGTVEACIAEAAAALIATHSHNFELLDMQAQLLLGTIHSISSAIDARDPYTCGHSERVGLNASRIARELGKSERECHRYYLCGLLHDVGKIGVPDSVLKKPGRLTDAEFAEIKKHPEIGYRIVKNLAAFSDLLPGILHHHESVDGSGYPHGLAGEAIPLQARVMAVADAYDAMTSDRPYRPGMPHEMAVNILRELSGKQWDGAVVEALLRVLEDEPQSRAQMQVSSAVFRSSNGTTAITSCESDLKRMGCVRNLTDPGGFCSG